MVFVPGLGGSSYPGGLAGIPGPAGQNGAAGSNGTNGTNGFIVLGTGTMSGDGTSFNISLSTAITVNKSVLIVADFELATASNPDFLLYPSGATTANYTYRFYGGAHAATGTEPRVARISSGGAIAQRGHLMGVLTLGETGRFSWSGQYSNSLVSNYGQSTYYGTSDTQSSVSTLVFASTVSGALASGSKLTAFQLW